MSDIRIETSSVMQNNKKRRVKKLLSLTKTEQQGKGTLLFEIIATKTCFYSCFRAEEETLDEVKGELWVKKGCCFGFWVCGLLYET